MKTVIEMVQAAGFFPERNWDHTNWHAAGFNKSFERLVEIVRADAIADEREACAKVCEPQEEHDDPLTAWKIAAAIRARGNT